MIRTVHRRYYVIYLKIRNSWYKINLDNLTYYHML